VVVPSRLSSLELYPDRAGFATGRVKNSFNFTGTDPLPRGRGKRITNLTVPQLDWGRRASLRDRDRRNATLQNTTKHGEEKDPAASPLQGTGGLFRRRRPTDGASVETGKGKKWERGGFAAGRRIPLSPVLNQSHLNMAARKKRSENCGSLSE